MLQKPISKSMLVAGSATVFDLRYEKIINLCIYLVFFVVVLQQKQASVELSVPQKYTQFICLFIWLRVEWEEMEMSSGYRGLLTLNKICEFFCQ